MQTSGSWRESVASAFLALGGAALFSLCFARQPSLWLPWVALVPLFLLLGRRRVLLWGFVYGICLWLGSMYWIAGTLEAFGGLTAGLSLVVQGLLALYLGLDQLAFALLGHRIWRRGGHGIYWALPALWVALEWLRGVAFGRFPWNLAAYAWVDLPGALPLAGWVGAFGVSFLLVFANVGCAEALRRRRWEPAVIGILGASTLLVLAGRWSRAEPAGSGAPAVHQVSVIQPNSPIVATWEESRVNYERLIEMSDAECSRPLPKPQRRLLVWPESAAWPHSYPTSERLRRDVARLAALGCDVLLGSQINEGEKAFNSVLLVDAAGAVGTYAKRRLVPWGEYVPLARVLPFMGRVARHAGDFTPGTEVALLPWSAERLGVAICYEVIFAAAVAEQVRAGASVLVTVTNDAWYGDTTAPHQHFRAARFRAAENRRPLLRAALTGISGLVDRRGRVTGRLEVGERGVLRGRVSGATDLSPYSRAPWLVPVLSAVLATAGIARRRGSRRTMGRAACPGAGGVPPAAPVE